MPVRYSFLLSPGPQVYPAKVKDESKSESKSEIMFLGIF